MQTALTRRLRSVHFILEAAGAIERFRAGAGYDLICILAILFVERVEAKSYWSHLLAHTVT